jgi:murein DD-endopeptidase MepM/ murein hydrolase activator NlpD
MKRVFYVYNHQTLSYERIYLSWQQRTWVVFRHLLVGTMVGAGVFLLSLRFFTSPREQQLKKENMLLQTQYEVLTRRMNEASLVLKDLQQRDNDLYRVIYQVEPIPASVRESGFGGINRYEALIDLPNDKLLIATTKKMDILTKQLYTQHNSYDEIFDLAKNQSERLKCIPGIQPIANKDLMRISSGFGTRIDPIYNTHKFHEGMDFKAETGTEIYATGNGAVSFSGWRQGYGYCIIIDHGYGYESLYAHCDKLFAGEGKTVLRGEIIATVGSSGKSTGSHLHYEVRIKGRPDNPAKYYFMDLSPEEYDKMFEIAANRGQVMD